MRTAKPLDRFDLNIKKSDCVLEVGSGHNPSFRSDVLVDKYVTSNYHRCGDLKIYPHQKFVEAGGENLPFGDKEFDYIICNQVMEHVDDPHKFVSELSRVASRGYIETPSLLGEHLFPKDSHRWVILDIDDKLVFFEKSKMPGNYGNKYGRLFLDYLPYKSLVYKLLWYSEGDLFLNRYEWAGKPDIIVDPTDEYYRSFFTEPWTPDMAQRLYPRKGVMHELRLMTKALRWVVRRKCAEKFGKTRIPVNIEDHKEEHAEK